MTDRISEQLTLDQVLAELGEHYHGKQNQVNARCRLRNRLRNIEELTGKKLIVGEEGTRQWTTRAALRDAWPHLIEDKTREEVITDSVKEYVAQFLERIVILEEKVKILAREVVKLRDEP